MRETKFRGLGVDGKWWFGESSPVGEHHINLATFFANLHAGAIRPETVGEWTGSEGDRNGKEIYEGDIGKPRSRFTSTLWVAYWDERVCQFRVCANGDRQFDKTHTVDWIDEVIGNIYEIPKLLGKKETV